jgi:hypothetical protein
MPLVYVMVEVAIHGIDQVLNRPKTVDEVVERIRVALQVESLWRGYDNDIEIEVLEYAGAEEE